VSSHNTINLLFPYQGEQHPTLTCADIPDSVATSFSPSREANSSPSDAGCLRASSWVDWLGRSCSDTRGDVSRLPRCAIG
jgi:hypothetical protein